MRAVRVIDTQEGLSLFAMGHGGFSWYPVQEDGSLGAEYGNALWIDLDEPIGMIGMEMKHAVIPRGPGFRVLTENHSLYLWQERSWAEAVPYEPALSLTRYQHSFKVELVLEAEETVYVVWSAVETIDPEEVFAVGLGVLDAWEHVTPLGEPFYRGPSSFRSVGYPNIRVYGGWDPDTRHFWIDCVQDKRVFELEADGTVLRETMYGASEVPYLTNWIKLPSGRWAGLHGIYWCLFNPSERSEMECCTPVTDSPGRTSSVDQHLTKEGKLWLVYPVEEGIFMGRWNHQSLLMETQATSPVTIGECSIIFATL